MVQIALDCPYCHTKRAGFQGSQYVPFRPGDANTFVMFMQCQVCGNCIVARYHTAFQAHFSEWVQGRADRANSVNLVEVQPTPESVKSPAHIPDNVKKFFLQGMESLGPGHYDAAGTMFRKSLDTALKALHPDGRGTLYDRIEGLPANIGVTPSMKEWAHQIRHLGNDAAHDDDPFTQAEAEALQSFTELFLTYTFTLPGMVAARRATPPTTP